MVILTELGPTKYCWRLFRNGRSSDNHELTPETREALKRRGRVIWATGGFGTGACGEQKAFEIRRRDGRA